MEGDEGLCEKVNANHSLLGNVKTCGLHSPELADLVCIECEVIVCQSCQFIDSHRNHTFRFVADQVESSRAALNNVRSTFDAKKTTFQENFDEMADLLNWVDKVKGELLSKLEFEKKILIKKIELDYQKAKAQIVAKVGERQSKFEKVSADLDENLTLCQKGLDNIEEVLQCNDPFRAVTEAFAVHHWNEKLTEQQKNLVKIMPTAKDDFTVNWKPTAEVEYMQFEFVLGTVGGAELNCDWQNVFLRFSQTSGLLNLETKPVFDVDLHCSYCGHKKIEQDYSLNSGDLAVGYQFSNCHRSHPSYLKLLLDGKSVDLEH